MRWKESRTGCPAFLSKFIVIGYILAYFFKDHQHNYSFFFLARSLGISISEVDELISILIDENQLAYNSENMLSLTPQGRLCILNSQADFLPFDESSSGMRIINPKVALALDRIYIPENFISKLK